MGPKSKNLTHVSDLLAKGQGLLEKLRRGAVEADRVLAGVRAQLPEELAEQVWGAVLKGSTLTLLVRSAAWGTRIRYHTGAGPASMSRALAVKVDKVAVKVRTAR